MGSLSQRVDPSRLGRLLVVVLVLGLAVPAGATAGNVAHPRLDELASHYAGSPRTVWCEVSAVEWNDAFTVGGLRGEIHHGFAELGGPTAFVAPTVCLPLLVALNNDYRDAGLQQLGFALLVLLHEIGHVRGISVEREANCYALPLVRDAAVRFLRVPARVPVTRTRLVTRTITRRIDGRNRQLRIQVREAVTVQVENPDLARIEGWARFHNENGYPEYRC